MKNQIDKEIRKEIMRRIKAAKQEHNVKVLFAIESGSRARYTVQIILTSSVALSVFRARHVLQGMVAPFTKSVTTP